MSFDQLAVLALIDQALAEYEEDAVGAAMALLMAGTLLARQIGKTESDTLDTVRTVLSSESLLEQAIEDVSEVIKRRADRLKR